MTTHKLVTIGDMLRVVTMENVDALAADIRGLLVNAAATKALTAIQSPKLAESMFDHITEVVWKDDGVNRQSILAETEGGRALEFKTTGKPHKRK